MEKGFLQVYTGNGKGKTTAAIGLSIRAAGAKLRVLFAQFVKGMKYSEIGALERFEDFITVKQYGRGCFIVREAEQADIDVALKGLREIEAALKSGTYDLVILDEANIAIYYKLFSVQELLQVISARNSGCEVVITGRYAPPELIEAADLVTEMKEIKHYYEKGVDARDGIER
jgi:cob(I)alamin adenosyltransferase